LAVPTGTTILPASSGMSTYGFTDDYIGSCDTGGSGGRDRVFQITPAATGTMHVSVGYLTDGVTPSCPSTNPTGPFCWLPVIYARTACATASTEVTCTQGVDATSGTAIPATLTFAVTANTPYWVIVDGFDGASYSYGPFNLIVNLQ
jgi:hypothetical protein